MTSVRDGGNVTEAVARAGVYAGLTREAAQSYGVYTAADVKVTIDTPDLTFTPKPRDYVTYNGAQYVVLDVATAKLTMHHVVSARNLALAHDLRQTGTLYRPDTTQDAAGRIDPDHATVTADVPCRVQPEGMIATDVYDRRTGPQRFTAYVGQQLTARAKDVWETGGQRYTVLASHTPERIDSLMSLDLEMIV